MTSGANSRSRRVMKEARRRAKHDPTCRDMSDALKKAWQNNPRRIITPQDNPKFYDNLIGFQVEL